MLIEAERIAHLGHWERDLRTGKSFWSDQVFEILGYAPGSVVPGTEAFLEAVAPHDRARIGDAVAGTAADGVDRRGEYQVVTPGGIRDVIGTVELLRDGAGAPERIVGTVQDITDRKRLERELSEADRRKDVFLAVLAHELRAPLNTILMSAQVLEHIHSDNPHAGGASAALRRAVAAQTRLVEDLLDVSRIVSGKLHMKTEAVDLAAVVRAVVDDVLSLARARDVALELRVAAEIGTVEGDALRLRQVVENLLTNAIKFTPHGGHVWVHLEGTDGKAQLTVQDTGIGIPAEILPRIFSMFVQADASVAQGHRGLGLGLSIVRRLVEAHGGEVQVESAGEGDGACFRVLLPTS